MSNGTYKQWVEGIHWVDTSAAYGRGRGHACGLDRRRFLTNGAYQLAGLLLLGRCWVDALATAGEVAVTDDWLTRWEHKILSVARARYCDTERGEEIGWKIAPLLDGFRYGWKLTGDREWVARLADWTTSWIARAVPEPDGFMGWPKQGSGGRYARDLYADSLLGEAMAFRPVVLMAREILETDTLKPVFAEQAATWLVAAEQAFEKWQSRGCWRQIDGGGVWVVPPFGIDQQTNGWTKGYQRRRMDGFTHPANKQNLIARWLLAMHAALGKPTYREHARLWWQVMKSRMRLHQDKYYVWNYWDPAGPWDYRADGKTRHWVNVHSSGGYYRIDVDGMVAAYEEGLVFDRSDLDRLIATNRDFMWNQNVDGAKFRRIDGAEHDRKGRPVEGQLWPALVPYDARLSEVFKGALDPGSWGALPLVPWYLARMQAG